MRSNRLWRREHDDVIPGVIEERVTHTDLDVRITDEVQAVARFGLVVDPPIHRLLTGEGRITAVDVLAGECRHVSAGSDPRLNGRAVRAGVREELVTCHVVGVCLGGAHQLRVDVIGRHPRLRPIGVDRIDHVEQADLVNRVGTGNVGESGPA